VHEAGDLVVMSVRVNAGMYELMKILAKSCNLPVDTLAERFLADRIEASVGTLMKTALEVQKKNGGKVK
jgi:hypothetical protein